jgi:hypothetical protein
MVDIIPTMLLCLYFVVSQRSGYRNLDVSGVTELSEWHMRNERACRIIMATLLPPPKRQKVYHGVPEPEKDPVEQSPNIVVQFVSEDDGSALAPAVSLPANVSREDLQSLVNTLTSKVYTMSTIFSPLFTHRA